MAKSTTIYGPYGAPISTSQTVSAGNTPPSPVNQFQPANNNWWQWTQNFLTVFTNPLDLSIRDCEKMARTDETCYASLKFTELAALARLGDYTHPRTRIERFIRKTLSDMGSISFIRCAEELLSARWAGYGVAEILYRESGGKIVLDGLQALHPDSIHFDIYKEGPLKNRLRVVYQWLWQSYEAALPPEKCVVFSHDMRFGNIYGEPVVRSIYAPWFLKTSVLLKAWGLALERYGTPIGVAQVPNGNDLVDPTGTMGLGSMTVFEYISSVIDNLSSRSSLTLSDSVKYDLKYAPAGFGKDFEAAISYCNQMIARGCLVPSLVADHGSGHGSYSLGQKHFDLFVLTLEKLLNDLIEVLVHQLIRRLIILNFGEQSDGDYGDFQTENFQADDEKLLSEVFVNLVNSGILDPSRIDDLNFARDRMGLSLLDDKEAPLSVSDDEKPVEDGEPVGAIAHPAAAIEQPIPSMRSTSLVGRMRDRGQRRVATHRSQREGSRAQMTEALLSGIRLSG